MEFSFLNNWIAHSNNFNSFNIIKSYLITKKEKQKYLEEFYNWLKEKQIMVLAGSAM